MKPGTKLGLVMASMVLFFGDYRRLQPGADGQHE